MSQKIANLPKISFITPTLNATEGLDECLKSIKAQDYPGNKVEIIITDGGSTDDTLEIARFHGAKVFKNKLKTAESGKALGVKKATGEVVCFVDSDNVLEDTQWLAKMVVPLIENEEIIGSEPIYFTYRKEDGFIDRYCALIGMNDPLVWWLGSYDRYNVVSKKWTNLPVEVVKHENYLVAMLKKNNIPTIGANGAMFRKTIFTNTSNFFGEYLFDTDILEFLVQKYGMQKFAKVDVGIVHLYSGSNLRRFAKKQLRRVRDYLYRRKFSDIFIKPDFSKRKYSYGQKSSTDFAFAIIKFTFSCIMVFPLVIQACKGYKVKKDLAWFAHPILCWITLVMYSYGALSSFISRKELSRKDW